MVSKIRWWRVGSEGGDLTAVCEGDQRESTVLLLEEGCVFIAQSEGIRALTRWSANKAVPCGP